MSPPTVFLSPPNKLVLEIEASGRYLYIAWFKDSTQIPDYSSFHHFKEIYLVENTTVDLVGNYSAMLLVPGDPDIVPRVTFDVILPGTNGLGKFFLIVHIGIRGVIRLLKKGVRETGEVLSKAIMSA